MVGIRRKQSTSPEHGPAAEILRGAYVQELDGVRGTACLLVVLLHTWFGIVRPNFTVAPLDPIYRAFIAGGAGVDLFFVLSGFLIGGILLDHRTARNYFQVFWIRRAARILPALSLLYATYLAGLAAAVFVHPPWLQEWLLVHPLPFWSYLTFTQNYFMAAANSAGPLWIGITWSLAVEEQFYLVAPFLVYFLPRRALVAVGSAVILVAPLLRGHLFKYGFYTGYMPTPCRADTLMWGVLVACAVRSPPVLASLRRWRPLFDVAAIAGVWALVWRSVPLSLTSEYSLRAALFAYFIARIFFSDGVMRAVLRQRFLIFIGVISYSFYLYHQCVNGLLHGIVLGHAPQIDSVPAALLAPVVWLVAGALATVSTYSFEMPFRQLARRLKYHPTLPVPSEAAVPSA
jgi:peptidoglycan/LPS O-acetylase OafA/YrhL